MEIDLEESMANKENTGFKWLTVWLWFAMITVVVGAFMLYPIGNPVADVAFLLVKAGMLVGIIWLLVSRKKKAFVLWAVFSALAVVMTLIKWSISGAFDWTFALAMATDVVVPLIGYLLLKMEVSSK
jgi:hypothetical protein